MKLLPLSMRSTLAGDQFCENEHFPFNRIYLEVKETHHCPFCGKGTVNFRCDCEEFERKLEKLQDAVHDEKHETMIHLEPYENLYHHCNDISFILKPLSMKEISKLGPNFWDKAQKLFDEKSKKSFFVTNLDYKEEELDFICKEFQSKEVYRCSLMGIGYNKHKIYLGYIRKRVVSNGDNTLGNRHLEEHWKNLAEFEDWNFLCEKLQSI